MGAQGTQYLLNLIAQMAAELASGADQMAAKDEEARTLKARVAELEARGKKKKP